MALAISVRELKNPPETNLVGKKNMTLPFGPVDKGLVSLKGGFWGPPNLLLPNFITTQNMKYFSLELLGDKYEVGSRQQAKLVKPACQLAGMDIAS